jgi:predicted esterase
LYLDQALQHVFETYSIDPGRVGLGGFSDGASYALSLGVANGDLFSHIIAFSPGFMRPPAQVREQRGAHIYMSDLQNRTARPSFSELQVKEDGGLYQ